MLQGAKIDTMALLYAKPIGNLICCKCINGKQGIDEKREESISLSSCQSQTSCTI